jgi:predicted Fe-Mo cluster-binding NifX family protein
MWRTMRGEMTTADRKDHDMKIAVVTDDDQTISRHFGRARMYAVLTVEAGAIVSRELRDKSAPHWRSDRPHEEEAEGEAHGTGPVARGKHLVMLEAIGDCAALIAGGMGRGAYDHAAAAGIRPIVTSLRDVDEAAIECAAGRLVDEVERLH